MSRNQTIKAKPECLLSPREVEVLELLANGYFREEIVEMLPIKAVTVRAYLENARDKLNARSVLHAATRALAQGLIAMADDDHLINESSRTENTKGRTNLVSGRGRSLNLKKSKTKKGEAHG